MKIGFGGRVIIGCVCQIYQAFAARHQVFSKVLAACKANLIPARARKNKRTSRMLANAGKDHSIPRSIVLEESCRILSSFRKVLIGNKIVTYLYIKHPSSK